MDDAQVKFDRLKTTDTAALQRNGGRTYANEHSGLITTWQEFESFDWPDPETADLLSLEWYTRNLPDDMCIIGAAPCAHLPEMMGYETLCYALADHRDLVAAISGRINQMYDAAMKRMLQFDHVKFVLGMDDMGFRSATLISPGDLRDYVLPGHKIIAQQTHQAHLPYILHCCGNISHHEISDRKCRH